MFLTTRAKLQAQPFLSISIADTLHELPQCEACVMGQPLPIRGGTFSKVFLPERRKGPVSTKNIQAVTNTRGRMGVGSPLFGWPRRSKEGSEHHEGACQNRVQCLKWRRNDPPERGLYVLFRSINYGQRSHECVIHCEAVSIHFQSLQH